MIKMHDWFGIKEKDREIERLKSELDKKNIEISKLKRELDGVYVCSGYCSVCKNGIKQTSIHPIYGEMTDWLCKLKCLCKFYEEAK